ncbi:MAG: ribonuclease H-like domain-containing protein [Chloroflexota bacterium]
MTSLSERLKELGVQVGARNLNSPPQTSTGLDSILEGREIQTGNGKTYCIEKRYPLTHQHGHIPLEPPPISRVIAQWAKSPELTELPHDEIAFLDTETSGLSTGTGTFAFIVGVGRFEAQGFKIVQLFLRQPAEEVALLSALESHLASCQALVTFNGKSFDVPLLRNRYRLNNWDLPPINYLVQLDLLHLSRRLWRESLPDCCLLSLETYLLGVRRTAEDIPGWQIPDLYFDYLQTGDAHPLKNVFYHNAMDILSLVTLLHQASGLLDVHAEEEDLLVYEWIARGRLHEEQGDLEAAAQAYNAALTNNPLLDETHWRTLQRLSYVHKRRGDLSSAMALWRKAASQGNIYAYEEFAKVYEHQEKDYVTAMDWTQAAIHLMQADDFSPIQRARWLPELEYRLKRLERKIQSQKGCNDIESLQPS